MICGVDWIIVHHRVRQVEFNWIVVEDAMVQVFTCRILCPNGTNNIVHSIDVLMIENKKLQLNDKGWFIETL